MYKGYNNQKRAKADSNEKNSHQYQTPKTNENKEIYKKQYPRYNNQYKYNEENKSSYTKKIPFIKRQKQSSDNNESEKNMKVLKIYQSLNILI